MDDRSVPPKKRRIRTTGSERPRKIRRIRESLASLEGNYADDWKLNMGVSLADRLEAIATEKNLTILQVKRLLKDVLTNPTVVNAFRQYMSGQLTLFEPETGATSTSTRRHAQILGFDLSAFGPRSNILDLISRRSITRSLAKKLRAEMAKNNSTTQDAAPASSETAPTTKKPTTLLEMDFSDGEDEDETKTTEAESKDSTSASVPVATQRDEDYHPTEDDINLLRRDIYYDLEGEVVATKSDTDVEKATTEKAVDEDQKDDDDDAESSDSSVSSMYTVYPDESPQRDYFLRSRKSDDVDCLAGLTPNILSMLNEDGEENEAATAAAEADAQNLADALTATDASAIEHDPEDQIYTNFLQTLFEPSPHTTAERNEEVLPQPEETTEPVEQPATTTTETPQQQSAPDAMSHFMSMENKATPDEYDDPDFDVMAELEALCCDDLFDELRSDRAVRVSKMEAKELRRDLVGLFNDEEDSFDLGADTSGCPQTPESTATTGVTGNEQEVTAFSPPLPPPPFDYKTNERLRRQLSMHLQLLCSSYACCTHRLDLQHSVVEEAQKAFSGLQAAFRAAKADPVSYATGLADLNEVFEHAEEFLTQFGGLSIVPLPLRRAQMKSHSPLPLLPMPFNLIDFISRSPIWAYPALLPRGLASRPRALIKKPFTADEDTLIVLGIANAIEFSPQRFKLFAESLKRRGGRSSAAAKRSRVFSFIVRTLMPTKTNAQLQNRKIYMEKVQKQDWLGMRSAAQSAFYLLLADLTSGNFERLEDQRELLRACVSSLVQKTRLNEGGLQVGSVFQRPECWCSLPAEYGACCRALYSQVSAAAGKGYATPKPVPEAFFPVYRDAGGPELMEYFLNAMLSWWPVFENPGSDRRPEAEKFPEVSDFPPPTPPTPLPNATEVVAPTTTQPTIQIIMMPATTQQQQQTLQSICPSSSVDAVATASSSSPTNKLSATFSSPDTPILVSDSDSPKPPPPKTLSPVKPRPSAVSKAPQLERPSPPPPSPPLVTPCPDHHLSRQLPFLPQVQRLINSFHMVLDRVLRGIPTLPKPRSICSLTARFLRRCRRGNPTWLPAIGLATAAGREADELDVRRARSLLDRCRLHLGQSAHGDLVHALATDWSPDLSAILSLLAPSQPLWEEFVALCLTPQQARCMRMFPVYAQLNRVGQLHALLHSTLPRAKRLWSSLRKLADGGIESDSKQRGKRRYKYRRQRRDPKDIYKSAWGLLETGLRERYALQTQAASSLDPYQKPYSNFPQTYEVVETLARRPGSAPEKLLPRLVDVWQGKKMCAERLLWETSTELSSSAPTSSKSKVVNRCPCQCHDNRKKRGVEVDGQAHQQHTLGQTEINKSGSKADSLGLRHCIKCSLRVHQGVVYVDECNFHLSRVEITWPEDFVPPSRGLQGTTPPSAGPFICYDLSPSPLISPIPSCPSLSSSSSPPSTPYPAANQISTLQVLQTLESAVATCRSNVGNIEAQFAPPAIDLARRQVSVDFGELVLPTARNKSSAVGLELPFTPTVLSPTRTEDVFLPDEFDYSPPYPTSSIFQHPPVDVDDEACFNTEAFQHGGGGEMEEEELVEDEEDEDFPAVETEVETETDTPASWSMSEDRRLLEYFRSAESSGGGCSRRLFQRLAAVWPERSSAELISRFKYLMLVAFGEDHTVDLSCNGGSDCDCCDESSPEVE